MSWPPALVEREWRPARRRLQVLAMLRQIGETAEPREVDCLEAVRTAAVRRSGAPYLDPVAEAVVLRQTILSESLRGLWEVKATMQVTQLTVSLDLARVRDLARDPALDPRVGDEGQPLSEVRTWRRVVVVREHDLVVEAPDGRHGHQETWSRARWETWASRCGIWLRAGTVGGEREVQVLAARLGLGVEGGQ